MENILQELTGNHEHTIPLWYVSVSAFMTIYGIYVFFLQTLSLHSTHTHTRMDVGVGVSLFIPDKLIYYAEILLHEIAEASTELDKTFQT